MSVSDWSTTPSANTSIDGIDIGENCSPANVNDALRAIMSAIRAFADGLTDGSGKQNADPTLTALAALVTSANKLIYATGADSFALTDLTAFARSMLASADAAAVRTLLGIQANSAPSGDGSSGKISFGTFTIAWRTQTASGGSGSTSSYQFGGDHVYSSWSKSFIEGDDGSVDVSIFVTSNGLSSANVKKTTSGTFSFSMLTIGV